jgi:hypothetical protein
MQRIYARLTNDEAVMLKALADEDRRDVPDQLGWIVRQYLRQQSPEVQISSSRPQLTLAGVEEGA